MAETAERIEQSLHWISTEGARARFDAEARRVMGMSGEEFLPRCDAGDFMNVHDDGENIDFEELEMLISWGRSAPRTDGPRRGDHRFLRPPPTSRLLRNNCGAPWTAV